MKTFRTALVAIFLLACHGAASQSGDVDVQNGIIERSNRRLAEIKKLRDANDSDISKSETGLKLIRNEIDAKSEIKQALDRKIQSMAAEIDADESRRKELEHSLAVLKKEYARFVYAAWKNNKTTDAMAFLLASRDFNDASRRLVWIRRYNRAREDKRTEIDSLDAALAEEIVDLRSKKAEQDKLKAESDAAIVSLGEDESKYESALKGLRSNRTKLETDARKEREKITAAQHTIDKIIADQVRARKERVEKTGLTQVEIALSGRFEDNEGNLPWPAGGPGTVIDHFGSNTMADGISKNSKGITIAARGGTEVRSVFEGTVTRVFGVDSFELCVTIRTGNYVVLYGNLSSASLQVGDTVALNQAVGILNDSGEENRNMLMFQIWHETTALDPEKWLRK